MNIPSSFGQSAVIHGEARVILLQSVPKVVALGAAAADGNQAARLIIKREAYMVHKYKQGISNGRQSMLIKHLKRLSCTYIAYVARLRQDIPDPI
jgi:hypothetical protein